MIGYLVAGGLAVVGGAIWWTSASSTKPETVEYKDSKITLDRARDTKGEVLHFGGWIATVQRGMWTSTPTGTVFVGQTGTTQAPTRGGAFTQAKAVVDAGGTLKVGT